MSQPTAYKRVTLLGGQTIVAHPEEVCAGQFCVIHNPSDHHMKEWPMLWRTDRKIMERICPHQVGIPDPDDLAYRVNILGEDPKYAGIHGSCGYGCGTERYIQGSLARTIAEGYDVTEDGRVWSYWRTLGPTYGNKCLRALDVFKELKARPNEKGYLRVQLGGKDRYVHALVYEAFHGTLPEGYEIRHKDGIPSNCHANNLEKGTSSENSMDKWKHGTMPHGEGHTNSKLTEELVRSARKLFYEEGVSLSNIKKRLKLSVHKGTLHEAVTRKTWAWLDSEEKGAEKPKIKQLKPKAERLREQRVNKKIGEMLQRLREGRIG